MLQTVVTKEFVTVIVVPVTMAGISNQIAQVILVKFNFFNVDVSSHLPTGSILD